MAVIKPFKGWQYNSEKIKNLDDVVVPPYDVISPEELKTMKARSPHNFANVILGEGENKHKRAADLMRKMVADHLLVQDQKPCLYFYRQTFKLTRDELFCQNLPSDVKAGGPLVRTGFFARVGLEDYSAKVIFPHEKTFAKHKDDRYALMTEAQGNMEPVFLGYDSQRFSGAEFDAVVMNEKLAAHFTDGAGVVHELWAIDDEGKVRSVSAALADQSLYILDGHHRYETALKFYNDHKQTDKRESLGFVLAQVCAFKQPGTVILPTHRCLSGIKNFNAQAAFERLGTLFDIAPKQNLADLEKDLIGAPDGSFGLKVEGSSDYYLLKNKNPGLVSKFKNLDLEFLHERVLPLCLEPKSSQTISDIQIDYLKKMPGPEFQLSFLVRPNTYDEVIRIARAFDKMPHKSTFFYPKIPSGLVVNLFE